jgi:hypothetical protein
MAGLTAAAAAASAAEKTTNYATRKHTKEYIFFLKQIRACFSPFPGDVPSHNGSLCVV